MALTKISSNLVADDAIVTGKIADGGVATADLAANAVTTAKIAQNNVTAHHIADGSVTTTQLGADSVTNAKIADDAISEEHLDKTIISDLTEVTAVSGDFLIIGDTSDSNNLKKAPISSLPGSAALPLAGGTMTGDLLVKPSASGATATSNTVGTFESNDNTEVSILGGSSSVLALNFGHSGDNDEGLLSFNTTSGSEDMLLQSTKDITLRTTSTNSTAGDINFKSYNTTIMHIDGGNNKVGIGTTSPEYELEVKASTDASINIRAGTSSGDFAGLYFGDTDYPAEGRITYQNSDNKMRFWSDRQHVMTLDDNARVGIGTASPSAPLHVQIAARTTDYSASNAATWGDIVATNPSGATNDATGIAFYNNASYHTNAATGIAVIKDSNSSDYGSHMAFITRPHAAVAVERMRIASSGAVGIGTNTFTDTRAVSLHLANSTGIAFQATSSQTDSRAWRIRNDDMAWGSLDFTVGDSNSDFGDSTGDVVMALTKDRKVGIGDTPNNLTSEIVTITTPASGGGQGIAFKRLDSNSDQTVGQIRFSNNSTDDLAFIKVTTDGAVTSSRMRFFTNTGSASTERLTILNNGNVGIGTTSPDFKLQVNGNGTFGTDGVTADKMLNSISDGGSTQQLGLYDTRADSSSRYSAVFHRVGTNGSMTWVGSISNHSGGVAYNTSSDYRLKENIDYTWDATTRLKALKPCRFNWISDETNTLQDGFLAHEVSDYCPQAVMEEKDGDIMQSIDHSKLVPLMIKTIQELEARIKVLEG